MKKFMQIAAALIVAVLLLAALPISAAESGGMTFAADKIYRTVKPFAESPNTFEAWIKLDSSVTGRGGVIIGNFSGARPDVSFEIHERGKPRLWLTDANGRISDYQFEQVNVATGQWVHLAIVRDAAAGKVYCYVNGMLKQSKNDTYSSDPKVAYNMGIGGDRREGNGQYFKGEIHSIAVYSDARTAAEIASDMNGYGEDSIIANYDLTQNVEMIIDKSGHGYNAVGPLIDPENKDAVTEYAYSFAVVGDTQRIAYGHKDKFNKLYKWILDNAQEKNTQFVFGLGDITETSSDAEWSAAMEAIGQLDGKIPYSLVRGNHDTVATFNRYVSYDKYKDTIGGSYGRDMINTYRMLDVGNVKYLIFTLDYGASDSVLGWAGDIIADNPDRNVIITTHAYLYRDGTTLDQNDVCPPATTGGHNNGDHMWDKLIKHYDNIVLVLSGHDPYDNIIMTQTKGVNGNTVTQMLIDPQGADNVYGGLGAVAMLYFSEDGRQVSVEYYSTLKEKYFMGESQFTMTLDVVGSTSGGNNTQGNTNKPSGTQKPTGTAKPTDAPATEAPTESATEQGTDAPLVATKGCGSFVSAGAICVISAGAALICMRERKRRRG